VSDQARPLLPAAPADNVVPLPGVLEAVIRALAGALSTGGTPSAPSADPAVDKPLLDLEETAGLLGVSRMTVARMADEGRLPSVVVRRGRVQKTRRIPRAFVDRMVADACAGAHVNGQVAVPTGGQLKVPTPRGLIIVCSGVFLLWPGLLACGRSRRL
jgi:excisionase family DNA binding protein